MDVKSFLHRIAHAFDAPEPTPLPEPDEKLALGALLVRVAKSDLTYVFAEISRIDRLLSRLFGLGPVEAAKMRATCERLDKAAPETGRFTHLIRDTVSVETRLDALEALWEVVLADGNVRPEETRVVEDVQSALGLSPEDGRAARARAEVEIG
jgi:uncharacterized tellurite resistance protein B-like protein